uniref:UDP-GlcNAc:betaGal beta-1,3-N-acetylglucosaminyltransferase-like protein 1 n=1 Tax=Styela clava TaxID=7725 RepID=UPI00193A7E7A|nr:UDP-GlcNAc:betaGal beta-1,3-N-acetylglucosaminyltransferase-like protein 1 [Styela clava]
MGSSDCYAYRVSIILPLYNGEKWLEECLNSVLEQTFDQRIQLCVYNDASTDSSMNVLNAYSGRLAKKKIELVLTQGDIEGGPKGCGYAKNRAVASSSGEYLCFLDADDIMEKERIHEQLIAAMETSEDTLIGSKVKREPEGSTVRYTKWINEISQEQLYTQIYTSNGPSVVMPTWFCHRNVYDKVSGFNEGGKGVPEDYLFFLEHLKLGGKILRVDRVLLMYRHHPDATTASVSENTIWKIRIEVIQERVLKDWKQFTIWNAGKQGRKFYRDLTDENREKVSAFCDVDTKKIDKGVYIFENSPLKVKPRVPILHFSKAVKPFVICMKLDLTGGEFEKNLNSLNLVEGVDYFHFN